MKKSTFLKAGNSASSSEHSADLKAARKRFAFIIPVFNHEETVAEVAKKCLPWGFPVFVIDDGSTDKTPQRLTTLKDITVITHTANYGKGAALLTGFAAAAEMADFAITIDADGQHDPAHASELMRKVKEGERPLIIGCRQAMGQRFSIPPP